MGSVGVIIRNACTKNTETEATNCLDHGLFLIIESCHKQFDKDVLVFGSNSTTRHLKTHKNELSWFILQKSLLWLLPLIEASPRPLVCWRFHPGITKCVCTQRTDQRGDVPVECLFGYFIYLRGGLESKRPVVTIIETMWGLFLWGLFKSGEDRVSWDMHARSRDCKSIILL